MDRKRLRQPLKETSGNVPSPKKRTKVDSRQDSGKLDLGKPKLPLQPVLLNPLQQQQQQQHLQLQLQHQLQELQAQQSQVSKVKTNRLVGDELLEWRSNWRKIMKSSVVYFDTQGVDTHNPHHIQDQKRANKGLRYVGSLVVPFYDKDVTIIVSRRSYNPQISYPTNDIFHDASNLKIKVWNFDKVFRFLKNLGVNDNEFMNNNQNDLVNLLKEEKIFGSTDKDPNAKRDDMHYLDNNFIYVYDLAQNVRPIAVREWYDNSYPKFYLTLDGKCPFIPDSENTDRKKIRRLKKFEELANYRNLLKVVAYELINHKKDRRISTSSLLTSELDEKTAIDSANDSTISQGSNSHSNSNTDDDKFCKPMTRNSSCLPTNNSNRFYDVAASGFNGTSTATAAHSIDSGTTAYGGNGLGPTISQVPSKNLNNLKRRIFMKRQKQFDNPPEKESKPGYCENCRIKYDNFDDHINSGRHRRFALDDSNFKEIDNLIRTVNENKLFGFIPSDGDFSYTE